MKRQRPKRKVFVVKAVNGKILWNDPVLMLDCEAGKGLTLTARRFSGFRSTDEVVLAVEPKQARFYRVGEGPRSAWTGGHPGVWDVHVLGCDGSVNAFRMKHQGDARALCKWVEEYAAARAARTCAQPSAGEQIGSSSDIPDSVEEYRACLANLCYRLSYLRGRETVQEVDAELSAIVGEMQSFIGVGKR